METIEGSDEIGLILSGVPVLQNLEFEAVQDIARCMQVIHYRAGDLLAEQGDRGRGLHILFDGKVELRTRGAAGDDAPVTQLGKGSVLGEVPMLSDRPHAADASAVGEARTLFLPRADFRKLVGRHASFAEAVCGLISHRLETDPSFGQVEKYRLLRKIGAGSTGCVFDALDTRFNRRVALKMLDYKVSHDPRFLSRFESEWRAIAALSHPNIVHVHAVVQEFSTHFVVMDRLPGKSLADLLAEQGPLSVSRTREILFPIAAALRYAHNQGVVHGAIKPSNIFIDNAGNAKLADFGLSAGCVEKVKPGIDVLALGETAFYMLTGRKPFAGEDVIAAAPPDIRELCNDVDEDMRLFMDKTLDRQGTRHPPDWNMIRVLLRPGSGRDGKEVTGEAFAFEVYLHNTPHKQGLTVLRQLLRTLDNAGIRHDIYMLNDDKGAEPKGS